MKNLKKKRRKDITICEAISDETREAEFYEFKQTAVNTLDETTISSWKEKWDFVEKRKIKTKTLNQILFELKEKTPNVIDLLSVDVEGHDFNVLQSIDLLKYRPRLIVVEIHNFDLANISENEIYKYLKNVDYQLLGYIMMNAYFLDSKVI